MSKHLVIDMDQNMDSIKNLIREIEKAGFSTKYNEQDDNPYYQVKYNRFSNVDDFEKHIEELHQEFHKDIRKIRESSYSKIVDYFDFIQTLLNNLRKLEKLMITNVDPDNLF